MENHLNIIEKIISKNYWTNWLGLSRTLLALSLILTLLLNDKTTLFYTGLQNESFPKFQQIEFNLFSWFVNFESAVIFSIVLLIPVLIGFLPRYTCFIHWFVTYSFLNTSMVIDGGDQVASIITFLLIPICTFDDRKWHWSIEEKEKSFIAKTVATFAFLLLTFQISIIYFFSAVGKFKVAEWTNGTAIYYWLTHPLFGAVEYFNPLINIILKNPILTAFLNWSVLILELAIAISIFWTNNNHKKILLQIGIVFHFFILLFLGIVSFSITMTACLILLLITKNKNYEFSIPSFTYSFNYISNLLSTSAKKN